VFKHFPENEICLMCGTSEDKECILIPVDGTTKKDVCEAIPVHLKCATKGDLRFNRLVNIFYKHAV
jgi:hypothetical protein